jgi:hypothetical protein
MERTPSHEDTTIRSVAFFPVAKPRYTATTEPVAPIATLDPVVSQSKPTE